MSMQRVRELALQGLSRSEITPEVTHIRPETVRLYFRRALATFTAAETAQREEARAKREAAPTQYHRKFSERRVLGHVHVRIGRQLLAARHEAAMNLGDFSRHWGFSNRVTLSAMEQGYHDFTVTEVYQIAEILGLTAEELLRPPPGAIAA